MRIGSIRSAITPRYNYTGIVIAVGYSGAMVRAPLTEQDRARGLALGSALRTARGDQTVREIAARAGLAEETVRKIERGAVPTPALFTIAAIAGALDIQLDQLVQDVTLAKTAVHTAAA